MYPILLKLGPLTLYSYGLSLVVGLLLAAWLAARAARRLPPELVAISPDQIADFSCLGLLGGIVGGRLLYVLLEWRFFLESPLEIFAIWHGGLVWYGGFFGGVLTAWVYTRVKKLDFLRVMDHMTPFLALGHAVGRIGCFFNGCCYGRPTTAWCGVVFPGHPGPVLPTQLFEAAALFILYLLLRQLQRPPLLNRPGTILGVYLIGYAIMRFFMEFLRGDQLPWWGGLTLQQWISLGMLLGGLIMLRPRLKTAVQWGR